MYQNCCKKCGSLSLYTEAKGNSTGLYCSDCGAWIKWLGKDELRAFEHGMRDEIPLFTKNKLKQFYEVLSKMSFKVDLGYTETEVVRLIDIEDMLVNQFK